MSIITASAFANEAFLPEREKRNMQTMIAWGAGIIGAIGSSQAYNNQYQPQNL